MAGIFHIKEDYEVWKLPTPYTVLRLWHM